MMTQNGRKLSACGRWDYTGFKPSHSNRTVIQLKLLRSPTNPVAP